MSQALALVRNIAGMTSLAFLIGCPVRTYTVHREPACTTDCEMEGEEEGEVDEGESDETGCGDMCDGDSAFAGGDTGGFGPRL